MKKRILILNEGGISGGGTEKRIKLLIKEMLKDTSVENVHLLRIRTLKNKRYLKFICKKFGYHESSILGSLFYIYKLISKYNINIIQVHNLPLSCSLPLLSCLIKKIPMVFYVHDFWVLCPHLVLMHPLKYKLRDCENKLENCIECSGFISYLKCKFKKIMINRCKIGVAPGNKIKDVLQKNNILSNKLKVVRPWIDMNYKNLDLENISTSSVSIVFVGSLLPYKGAHVFAEALALLKIKGIQVYIAGTDQEVEGKYRKNIEALLKDISNVNFLGKLNKNQLLKLLVKTNIFIMPSIWPEIFGLVWAEAAYSKNFIIASDVGGISEYVKDIGLVFKNGDAEDLAEKIELCIDKGYYKDQNILDRNKQYILDNFNINRAYSEISEVYDNLIRS